MLPGRRQLDGRPGDPVASGCEQIVTRRNRRFIADTDFRNDRKMHAFNPRNSSTIIVPERKVEFAMQQMAPSASTRWRGTRYGFLPQQKG